MAIQSPCYAYLPYRDHPQVPGLFGVLDFSNIPLAAYTRCSDIQNLTAARSAKTITSGSPS